MSTQSILIILIASLIGLAYLIKVRSYDIYEKESFWRLLIVAIVGGFLSVIFALYFYESVDVRLNFLDAIIKIGFIEESSKLLALALIYLFIKKDFNEIVDGIIYITAISLGFAIIENISYCFRSEEPFLLLLHSLLNVFGATEANKRCHKMMFYHIAVG